MMRKNIWIKLQAVAVALTFMACGGVKKKPESATPEDSGLSAGGLAQTDKGGEMTPEQKAAAEKALAEQEKAKADAAAKAAEEEEAAKLAEEKAKKEAEEKKQKADESVLKKANVISGVAIFKVETFETIDSERTAKTLVENMVLAFGEGKLKDDKSIDPTKITKLTPPKDLTIPVQNSSKKVLSELSVVKGKDNLNLKDGTITGLNLTEHPSLILGEATPALPEPVAAIVEGMRINGRMAVLVKSADDAEIATELSLSKSTPNEFYIDMFNKPEVAEAITTTYLYIAEEGKESEVKKVPLQIDGKAENVQQVKIPALGAEITGLDLNKTIHGRIAMEMTVENTGKGEVKTLTTIFTRTVSPKFEIKISD